MPAHSSSRDAADPEPAAPAPATRPTRRRLVAAGAAFGLVAALGGDRFRAADAPTPGRP